MSNILTTENIIDSKIYIRNEISFMHPRNIIEPFLDNLHYSNEEIRIAVQDPVVNVNDDGTENIAYPRFLLELKKEDVVFNDTAYQNVFGILVAMDQQHPQIKVYSGMNVSACLNLSIFNAEDVFVQNLNNGLSNIWSKVQGYYEGMNNKLNEYRQTHTKLISTYLNQQELTEKLGYLLRNGAKSKLGTSPVVGAAKLLDDRKSTYFVEKDCSLFNLYNAVTQNITDSKDILFKPEKTLGLTKLLLN